MPRRTAIRPSRTAILLPTLVLGITIAAYSIPSPLPWQSSTDRSQAAQTDNAGSDASKSEQDSIPAPVPRGKKLIMKDGSFQIVREYSVQGDRVRYWSAERSDWEEIPTGLVDWDATHKADAAYAQQQAALTAKLKATETQKLAHEITIDKSLEIKPGIFLPDAVGFYLLDGKRVLQMKQDGASTKTDKARAIERAISGVPMIPIKHNFELDGEHATLRITSIDPEFYIRPADQREPRFALVRAQIKDGRRVLENISQLISGQQDVQSDAIEFQTWTPADGVFRYTPEEQLTPGEYAFIETTNQGVSAYVWDFGVDAPKTLKQK